MSERIKRQACFIMFMLPLGIGLAFGFFCGMAVASIISRCR